MIAILQVVAILILFFIVVCFIHYKIWRAKLVKKLNSQSSVIKTSMGDVEYISIGPDSGPVFLLSHGGGSGYDNAYLYDFLAKEGFRIICPSKPGYLRTPLSAGKTFEEHADMFAAVLDALGVKKTVAIAGISLGGPAALQFALRHPGRTACLVMQDAVSHDYRASEEAKNSILGKLFLNASARELLSWLMTLCAHLWPEAVFMTYLQEESLYEKNKLKEIASEVMKDPENIKKMKQFADMTAPLALRAPGMDNELIFADKLPRYKLENISAPVLVTQSRMDKDVEKSHGEFVADTVPNAESYYFDGCGHLFWFGKEWPEIKFRLIKFLKKHTG